MFLPFSIAIADCADNFACSLKLCKYALSVSTPISVFALFCIAAKLLSWDASLPETPESAMLVLKIVSSPVNRALCSCKALNAALCFSCFIILCCIAASRFAAFAALIAPKKEIAVDATANAIGNPIKMLPLLSFR